MKIPQRRAESFCILALFMYVCVCMHVSHELRNLPTAQQRSCQTLLSHEPCSFPTSQPHELRNFPTSQPCNCQNLQLRMPWNFPNSQVLPRDPPCPPYNPARYHLERWRATPLPSFSNLNLKAGDSDSASRPRLVTKYWLSAESRLHATPAPTPRT